MMYRQTERTKMVNGMPRINIGYSDSFRDNKTIRVGSGIPMIP